MNKHLLELVGGALALGGAAYAYKRSKGMPAAPVAPSNPSPAPVLPPPGVVTSAAPSSMGAAATEVLTDGLDVTSDASADPEAEVLS